MAARADHGLPRRRALWGADAKRTASQRCDAGDPRRSSRRDIHLGARRLAAFDLADADPRAGDGRGDRGGWRSLFSAPVRLRLRNELLRRDAGWIAGHAPLR